MQQTYELGVGLDELAERFTRHFLGLGWRPERRDGVLMAEGPRAFSRLAVVILLLLGAGLAYLSTSEIAVLAILEARGISWPWSEPRVRWFSLLLVAGALAWITALAHIIAADRHRVAVFQEAPGRYVVVANSHEALSAAERLLLQLGGRKVEVPMRPEEAYEALLRWYSSAWGLSGRRVLEERIERISRERGVSREQAILALYEEELGAAG
ncbi:MAG: hypothetical protein DRJ56_07275 [Thermoprotei archaeon]|nr:MAG: hypothetical protein DRJ56_07275 [Thermoprotei archaeon]